MAVHAQPADELAKGGIIVKITIAFAHFPPRYIGGTEKMTKRFAEAYLRKGHTVEIVVVESVDAPEGAPFCQTEVDGNLSIHRLYIDRKDTTYPLSLDYCNEKISRWYMEHIKDNRPDVIHLLSGYLITGCILEAAFAYDVPSVVTLVDFWFLCPLITLMRTDGSLCERPVEPARCVWCLNSNKRRYLKLDEMFRGAPGNIFTYLGTKGLLKPFKQKQAEIHYIEKRRDYNRYLLESADVVVTHTRFLENKLYEYGIHPREVFFFPNGIEIDPSAPPSQKARREHGKLVIGYMGQVAVHKGVDVLVKAYRLLDPEPGKCELRIYGDLKSWPDYTKELRALAGGRPDILFAGPYPAQEAGRVMDECDVIVVPSVWYENRPTVILEAFSRGKPVITSDLGGMTEQVRHGVDGFLFKPRDPQSLADQLRKLVDDPNLLQKLSEGIGTVMDVSAETDELEKLYQRLIETKKKTKEMPV